MSCEKMLDPAYTMFKVGSKVFRLTEIEELMIPMNDKICVIRDACIEVVFLDVKISQAPYDLARVELRGSGRGSFAPLPLKAPTVGTVWRQKDRSAVFVTVKTVGTDTVWIHQAEGPMSLESFYAIYEQPKIL